MNERIKRNIGIIIFLTFWVLLFCIAGYETDTLKDNKYAENACRYIWKRLEEISIINWFCGGISFVTALDVAITNEEIIPTILIFRLFILMIVIFLTHIPIIMINENLDKKCVEYYKDEYPQIIEIFNFEINMIYFYGSIIVLTLTKIIIEICKKCFTNKVHVQDIGIMNA